MLFLFVFLLIYVPSDISLNLLEVDLNAGFICRQLEFVCVLWMFKLLPRKCTETSIWCARPYASTF